MISPLSFHTNGIILMVFLFKTRLKLREKLLQKLHSYFREID